MAINLGYIGITKPYADGYTGIGDVEGQFLYRKYLTIVELVAAYSQEEIDSSGDIATPSISTGLSLCLLSFENDNTSTSISNMTELFSENTGNNLGYFAYEAGELSSSYNINTYANYPGAAIAFFSGINTYIGGANTGSTDSNICPSVSCQRGDLIIRTYIQDGGTYTDSFSCAGSNFIVFGCEGSGSNVNNNDETKAALAYSIAASDSTGTATWATGSDGGEEIAGTYVFRK